MQVTLLAEALVSSQRTDGTVSLHDLRDRLSRAGLEEMARAVSSLARRVNRREHPQPVSPKHPWI